MRESEITTARQMAAYIANGKPQLDDDGKPIVDTATCGTCGRSWNDAMITAYTPAPSGRCPFEYWHRRKETRTMTLKQAKADLRAIGITLSKRDGEYRVNFQNSIEATAYYTNDIEDAVNTGKAMAAKHLSTDGRATEPTPRSFDEFLDNAAHKVADLYAASAGGRALTTDELYALNDTLTAFFADRRTDRLAREWGHPGTNRTGLLTLAGFTPFEADGLAHSKWEDLSADERARVEAIFNR